MEEAQAEFRPSGASKAREGLGTGSCQLLHGRASGEARAAVILEGGDHGLKEESMDVKPPGLTAGSGAGGEMVRAVGAVASAYDWELSCSRALRQGPLDQASAHSGWAVSSRAGGGVRPTLM